MHFAPIVTVFLSSQAYGQDPEYIKKEVQSMQQKLKEVDPAKLALRLTEVFDLDGDGPLNKKELKHGLNAMLRHAQRGGREKLAGLRQS